MKQRDRIIDGISYGILILLFAGTLFCSSGCFVDEYVLVKKYVFIFFTSLLGCAFLLSRSERIAIDKLTIFVFLFSSANSKGRPTGLCIQHCLGKATEACDSFANCSESVFVN